MINAAQPKLVDFWTWNAYLGFCVTLWGKRDTETLTILGFLLLW